MKGLRVVHEYRGFAERGIVVSEPYPVVDQGGGYYATFVVADFNGKYKAVDIDYLTDMQIYDAKQAEGSSKKTG